MVEFGNRKNELEIIQKIIEEWILKYQNYKKNVWSDNLISIRIINWISNADIILNNAQKSFSQIFYKSLIKQITFVKKKFEKHI